MSWFYLILAILLETFGTTSLKLSNGFTVLFPSLGAIDVSIAYAIWGAFGILLISAIGIIFLHESVSLLKIISILFIIIGTVGLRLAS